MPSLCSPAAEPSPAFDWSARPDSLDQHWPSEALLSLLARHAPRGNRGAMTALDLGCGSGRHALLLAQLGFGRVIAVDPNAQSLEQARRRCQQAHAGVELVRAGADSLPLRPASVDVIVSWGVLFVLGGPRQTRAALDEAARVLRPGGLLIADWRTADDDLKRGARQVQPDTFALPADAPAALAGAIYSFWTREQAAALLSAAGLTLIDVQRSEIRDCLRERAYSWWQTCAQKPNN